MKFKCIDCRKIFKNNSDFCQHKCREFTKEDFLKLFTKEQHKERADEKI